MTTPTRSANAKSRSTSPPNDEQDGADEEDRERRQDRPGQGLVDGVVDDIRQALALPETSAAGLADAVEDHDRVVDGVPDDREERGQDGQRHLAVGDRQGGERRPARRGRARGWCHPAAEVEAERDVDQDARHARQHRVDRLHLQVAADLRPDELEPAHLEPGSRAAFAGLPGPRFDVSSSVPTTRGSRIRYSWASPNSWMTLSPA